MKKNILLKAVCCASILLGGIADAVSAQTDTLRVMAYNVLDYGEYPLCQGPNSIYNAYLDTIVQFVNPDILSLEKMGSIQTSPTDEEYTAAIGFQDSIIQYALNPAFPGRFTYCPFTNHAASGTESVLFYNQQKLGFVAITCSFSDIEDFNTYKLYYKDPNLSTTHDTTFLYVTVNHDQSGNSTTDGQQIGGEMAAIQGHFTHLANMLNMGDFNLRTSSEPCYQILTNPSDTNFRYYDPPFYPDAALSYPANWDGSPSSFARFLTTSTRTVEPNACSSSTTGGGKDWYDHIFISPWLVENADYMQYIPNSFHVVGNDGHRVGVAINSGTNTSAPPSVINSLYQMSNKYPVTLELLVTQNTTGVSPTNPEIFDVAVPNVALATEAISVTNPSIGNIVLHCSNNLVGKMVSFECLDMLGRSQMKQQLQLNSQVMDVPASLASGVYIVKIMDGHNVVCQTKLVRE